MIAPDKIYLPIYPTEDDCYVGDEWFLNPNPRAEDNIAYIRKGAILEWADKLREAVEKAEMDYASSVFCSTKMHDALMEGLNKLNEF